MISILKYENPSLCRILVFAKLEDHIIWYREMLLFPDGIPRRFHRNDGMRDLFSVVAICDSHCFCAHPICLLSDLKRGEILRILMYVSAKKNNRVIATNLRLCASKMMKCNTKMTSKIHSIADTMTEANPRNPQAARPGTIVA